jgi:hypothetical protein
MNLALTVRIELRQYAAIFSQNIIDVSHHIGRIAIAPVVICNPAMIAAIFFINASTENFSALEAGLFHELWFLLVGI